MCAFDHTREFYQFLDILGGDDGARQQERQRDDDQCGDDEVYNIFANTQNAVAPHTTSLHRTI